MALTPEDVVNKRFQPTKFREGYDQDEVDDFLDEVVVELRRLGQENEELRQRLVASDARISELQRSGATAAPAAEPVVAPVPVASSPEAAPAQAYAAGVDPASDPNNTNNLLQLARRLHEEHVREGIEKRDALIAEGHAAAARIVSEGEAQQRAELETLDQERTSLERRVEELRQFEREYRAKLKGHIEGLLHDLDGTAVPAGAPAEASQPEPAVTYDSVPSQPPASFQGFGGN
ncbi:DivIVA domain-containing protein [Leifsonella bigeumensis]